MKRLSHEKTCIYLGEDTDSISDPIEITQMRGNDGPSQGISTADRCEKTDFGVIWELQSTEFGD